MSLNGHPYLDISFRAGKPLVAYLSLDTESAIVRTQQKGQIVVDYDKNNKVVGIEILEPAAAPIERIREAVPELDPRHLEPLVFLAGGVSTPPTS